MDWLATLRKAAAGLVLVLALGACSPGSEARPTSPRPSVTEIGAVGKLPPSVRDEHGPGLSVPSGMVRVPGSFPNGSVVSFAIPVRNAGDVPISIVRLEAG